MANPFVKAWKYLMALFSSKVDEYADPKVQIQQAIEEAQRQHSALVQQAAAVIGNQRQLEMKLSRQLSDVENLTANARQALALSDQARASGDEAKAAEHEQTAQTFAGSLVAAEHALEDLKSLHDQALSAAKQAREAVETNSMILQQRLAERTRLLSQLEQARMQEKVAQSLESVSSLTAPGNVPTLDEVRDKIEARYANALGRAELASTSVEGRRLDIRRATMDLAGATRLEEIRASMAKPVEAAPEPTAVAPGEPSPAVAAEPSAPTPDHLGEPAPARDREQA